MWSKRLKQNQKIHFELLELRLIVSSNGRQLRREPNTVAFRQSIHHLRHLHMTLNPPISPSMHAPVHIQVRSEVLSQRAEYGQDVIASYVATCRQHDVYRHATGEVQSTSRSNLEGTIKTESIMIVALTPIHTILMNARMA